MNQWKHPTLDPRPPLAHVHLKASQRSRSLIAQAVFKQGFDPSLWKKDKAVLESVVQRAVGSLQDAPCLHVVSDKESYQTLTVPPAVEVVPQLWQSMSQHLSSYHPELLLLVHKISNEQPSTGFASTGDESDFQSTNLLLNSSLAGEIVAENGDGDACEGSDSALCTSILEQALNEKGMKGQKFSDTARKDGNESFWGLVIQSTKWASLQGCYLLKTMQVRDDAGFMCTHFSVTHVCSTVPLLHQFMSSWLV